MCGPWLVFPDRWGEGGWGLRKNPFRGGGMDNFWNHTINFMITYCNRKFFNLKQILYMKINLENFYSWTSFKWPVSGYGESGREMEVGCSKEVSYKLVLHVIFSRNVILFWNKTCDGKSIYWSTMVITYLGVYFPLSYS